MDFRFGDFEINLARRELRRAGAVVHLEPQVFDLLVHLVQNRDRIVSKDELIDVIWHGRIVSEESAALYGPSNGMRAVATLARKLAVWFLTSSMACSSL